VLVQVVFTDAIAAWCVTFACACYACQSGCEAGKCPWKGKRIVSLAMGRVLDICARVMGATSTRYKAAVLRAGVLVASRICEMEKQIKSRFCDIITLKLEYTVHVPHRGLAAFGAYCGYSLDAVKARFADCFIEFNAIDDKNSADAISIMLFSEESTVSQQLRAFSVHPYAQLHHFNEAFVEIQELAFGPSVERVGEGEHVMTKLATKRTFKNQKPASTCARQRKNQIEHCLDIPSEYDWLLTHWKSRTIYHELLAHKFNTAQIDNLTLAERHAHVYAYHASDHFRDIAADHANDKALNQIMDHLQVRPEVKTTPSMQLICSFLKCRLEIGLVCSIPATLFGAAAGKHATSGDLNAG
jgi:hypothetical protein